MGVAAGSRLAAPAPPGSNAPRPACRPPPSSGTVQLGQRPAQQRFFCPRGGERAWLPAPTSVVGAKRRAFRVSTSRVLRPSRRSSARMRSSSWRTLAAPITSSSTRTASRPPSAIRRLQLNSRLGERPCLRATNETDMPGCSVSSTSRIFSATDHRRRRCTEVITSTRWTSSDIAVCLGSCLGPHAMPPVRSNGAAPPSPSRARTLRMTRPRDAGPTCGWSAPRRFRGDPSRSVLRRRWSRVRNVP